MEYVSIKDIIIAFVITIVFIAALFVTCWFISSIHDTRCWNDGYCECGGTWVYEQAVGHGYGTGYMYHCDSCGEVIEIAKKR